MDLAKDMGPDAPMVVHENGSKESLCPFALDVTPRAIAEIMHRINCEEADWIDDVRDHVLDHLAHGLGTGDVAGLASALEELLVQLPERSMGLSILEIGRVLKHGEDKYGDDRNWRGIPVRQHLRHVLAHLFAHEELDRSEGEWGHIYRACSRLLFAIEIELTEAEARPDVRRNCVPGERP
ncbi:MAG TPA: dATP/dGTP diphosphohydrolase domain-containing protein [Candidatus Binatia bacterium]|nr:dATP/dGTP diphosphohydrolase domain-containing protein [Candidatus Binatia bacterium]